MQCFYCRKLVDTQLDRPFLPANHGAFEKGRTLMIAATSLILFSFFLPWLNLSFSSRTGWDIMRFLMQIRVTGELLSVLIVMGFEMIIATLCLLGALISPVKNSGLVTGLLILLPHLWMFKGLTTESCFGNPAQLLDIGFWMAGAGGALMILSAIVNGAFGTTGILPLKKSRVETPVGSVVEIVNKTDARRVMSMWSKKDRNVRSLLVCLILLWCIAALSCCSGGGSAGSATGGAGYQAGAVINGEENPQITQSQAETIYATDVKVSVIADQCLAADNAPQSFQNAAASIQTMEGVKDATAQGNALLVRYNEGISHIWIHTPLDRESNQVTRAQNSPGETVFLSRETPGNKQALILNCIAEDPAFNFHDGALSNITANLQNYGFQVDRVNGGGATIEFFKNRLNAYGCIVLDAHGCGGHLPDFGGDYIFNQTGQYAGERDYTDYYDDFRKGRIAHVTVEWGDRRDEHRRFLGISNSFIDYYFRIQGRAFPHTFFYNGGCQSSYNNSMASAYVNSGCAAYLGWTEVQYKSMFSAEQLLLLMSGGTTLGNAYNRLPDTWKMCDLTLDNQQIHAQLTYYPTSGSSIQLSVPQPSPSPSAPPSPIPSPTPSPSVSPAPVPSPSVTPSPAGFQIGENAPDPQLFTACYQQNNGAVNLGSPTNAVTRTTPSAVTGLTGYYQAFERGSLQQNGASVYMVYGPTYQKWASLRYVNGALGHPTAERQQTGPSAISGKTGYFQKFEGGSIQEFEGGVYAVYGSSYQKWASLRYVNGALGHPTTERQQTGPSAISGKTGYFQKFEGGSIQEFEGSLYAVHGAIYREWGNQSYVAGKYGHPVSDRQSLNGHDRQNFEGGFIMD
jgi:hypothetical protein